LVAAVALAVLVSACGSGGKHSAPPPSSTTVPAPTTSTTTGIQTSGARTVLSPIGLHVRAQPSKSARVLGTAAQGVVLSVLGYTAVDGGWYKVKGATVTGWISGSPTLSAQGEFRSFNGAAFNALYPATWSASQTSTVTTVFRSGSDADIIAANVVPNPTRLPTGRSGFGQIGTSDIVVCGVTSRLLIFQRAAPTPPTSGRAASAPAPYLAQVRVVVDPQHTLGFDAALVDLKSHLAAFESFLYSVTFASKQCTG
jgi:Bacterial SH3 domain